LRQLQGRLRAQLRHKETLIRELRKAKEIREAPIIVTEPLDTIE
jgi:hypothetical protein